MGKTASAGNSGPKIRSDCRISLELTPSGGIEIDLSSKVISLYGNSIRKLMGEMLVYFGIKNARVRLEDRGALPFVLMARLEAAVKQLVKTEKVFLPKNNRNQQDKSAFEKFRFTRLYLPGNSPALMLNAGIHKPDGLILDLEDSVAQDKKSEARFLVRNALLTLDFMGAEKMVRINQLPDGLKDLGHIVPHGVDLILIPKCERPEQILAVEKEINHLKKDTRIFLMPIIESAMGIENAFEIAVASPTVVAMTIGLEDYTADIGVKRTTEGNESLYARSRMVNACKAAGIQAIDSVFSDVADVDGLKSAVQVSRSLGFEGMGCIHPRQIKYIKEGFLPDKDEIEKAKRILLAYESAQKAGLGVVSLGTKMIDAPVVKRAERIILLALKQGLISENWKKEQKEDH
jgi:citrate lyase subunit beta/citryl-CoA lyase